MDHGQLSIAFGGGGTLGVLVCRDRESRSARSTNSGDGGVTDSGDGGR